MAKSIGLRWPKKLQRHLPYDGEKVWDGEWFACVHFGGTRCCAVLRAYETQPEIRMSFPFVMDGKRNWFPTTGRLGQRLWEIRTPKEAVLDGYLGVADDDTMEWDDLSGRHLPPGATLFVHDAYPVKIFQAGEGTESFTRRRKRVGLLVRAADSEQIRIAKYKLIESRKQFREMQAAAESVGGGLMLRRNAPYQWGKSGNILLWEGGDA